MRPLLVLAALLAVQPGNAVEIDWVSIGNPGNPPDAATNCLNDAADCGSVPYGYSISKYEITNSQYAEFLKAVAAEDPLALYNPSMGSNPTFGGITRSGAPGSYGYTSRPGFERKPVVFLSFYDALRFANWLHNGQPSGAQGPTTTEGGAYTITASGIEDNDITRNPGATVFVPSENEWYKAAYYDPALPGYYEYPVGTDEPTSCEPPGATPNTANCAVALGTLADVGSYAASASPYGTFDQGGNVWEWNESVSDPRRGVRGGAWVANVSLLAASVPADLSPTYEAFNSGFRVATLVPEPDASPLAMVLLAGLAARQERRKRNV